MPKPPENPDHYDGYRGVTCIEAIRNALTPEEFRGFLWGNVLKYMWRWPAVRDAFARNKFCAACGTRSQIEVHHLQPFHLVPKLELEASNLVVLCRSCHLVFGHLHSWESYNPSCVNDAAAHLLQVRGRP